MNLIEVQSVWKSYEEKTVLEDLNFTINEGEFVTIVGASGCGKTTFLRMILGEESPSSGSIEIDGKPLVAEPNRDRGVVFQRYSVFPHLTVLQNVLLGLELAHSRLLCRSFGKSRQHQIKQSREILDRVGLLAVADQYPDSLSGGMQQRLALSQTLIITPRIVLLDEPFGALDPGIRSDMHELVAELHSELGLTVLMVTHDISEGFLLGTRVMVFDNLRVDPHEPDLYGAGITYDIPLGPTADDRQAVVPEVTTTRKLEGVS